MGLILIPQSVRGESNIIPDWIKNTAKWWSEDQISETEFLNAIQFLIGEGIIKIPVEQTKLNDEKITIGFIPVEKASELTPKAEAFEKYLEEKLQVDIEIVVPTNYETIIEGMRFGHVDAAFMDTGPAWITHTRTGAEVVFS